MCFVLVHTKFPLNIYLEFFFGITLENSSGIPWDFFVEFSECPPVISASIPSEIPLDPLFSSFSSPWISLGNPSEIRPKILPGIFQNSFED